MLFTGESNYVFPPLLSRNRRIEITIEIKANFYKETVQFTLLLEIKSANIFSLLAFRKYSIFVDVKHTRAVNLTRAIQRGMICFVFPTLQAVK